MTEDATDLKIGDTTDIEAPSSFKSIFKSKTFWVNIVAFVAILIQQRWGYVIDESTQFQILTVINVILRSITSEEVKWK